jgi:hypothetical protein
MCNISHLSTLKLDYSKILRARVVAILILELFYKVKKKREILLLLLAILPISLCEFFLSIKTPHMHEYIFPIQNLLVFIFISYKPCITKSNIINEIKKN